MVLCFNDSTVQDLFAVQSWWILTRYWACNGILCHMALMGVRGLKQWRLPFFFSGLLTGGTFIIKNKIINWKRGDCNVEATSSQIFWENRPPLKWSTHSWSLTHSLTHSLARSFFCSLPHTLTHSRALTYWLTHQLTHSGTHSLLLSTAHWLTKLAPSLPRPFTRSPANSLIHLLCCYG